MGTPYPAHVLFCVRLIIQRVLLRMLVDAYVLFLAGPRVDANRCQRLVLVNNPVAS